MRRRVVLGVPRAGLVDRDDAEPGGAAVVPLSFRTMFLTKNFATVSSSIAPLVDICDARARERSAGELCAHVWPWRGNLPDAHAEHAQVARTGPATARCEKEACQKTPGDEQAAAAVPSGARRASAIFHTSYESRVFEGPRLLHRLSFAHRHRVD